MDEVLRYRQLWGHSREQNLSGASGRGAFFQHNLFLCQQPDYVRHSLWLLSKRARFSFRYSAQQHPKNQNTKRSLHHWEEFSKMHSQSVGNHWNMGNTLPHGGLFSRGIAHTGMG